MIIHVEFFPDINVNDFDFETVTVEDFTKKILDLNINPFWTTYVETR